MIQSRRDNTVTSYSFQVIVLLSLLWMASLTACGSVSGSKNDETNPTPAKPGKIYVANAGDGSIIAFDQALTTKGNISPARRFPESITGPTGIFLDRTNDTLYVANTDHNSILIYEHASTLNLSVGSANATRTISGPHTGMFHPYGVAYDATRDRLYVSNKDKNVISVFQKDCPQANILNGDIAPCRTLSGPTTLIDTPKSLAIDTQRDILYIANAGTNSILVYENASQSATQGDLAPTRTIISHSDASQTDSMLFLPSGLFIDSTNDRLYVVNTGKNQPAIFIYEKASTRSDAALPDRLLIGQNTHLTSPIALDVSVDQDRLYVLNNNNTNNGSTAVMLFDNFNSQCVTALCNFGPTRVINGPTTGLTNPSGIAYDPARDIVYVANTLANDILIFTLEGNLPPLKVNKGDYHTTDLLQPTGFFYDAQIDRLYIANFNSASANLPPIIVYENVSTKTFLTTKYDWAIQGSDIQRPRSIYVDKTRQYLIVLNTPIDKVLIYNLSALSSPPSNGGVLTLQSSDLAGTFSGVDSLGNQVGFIRGTSMAVDEAGGFLYVAADCDAASNCPNFQPNGNSIFIYNLGHLTDPPHVIGRGCVNRDDPNPNNRGCENFDNIKLNRPYGLFYDSAKDILYVTNVGSSGATANTILAFNHPSSLGDTLASCNTQIVSTPQNPNPISKCANLSPNRIISSSTSFSASEQMQAPIAPFVNQAADRLFLINSAKDSLFIFENASTLSGDTRPDRIISGTDTQLAFSGNFGFTGALFVNTNQGKETLYVGQPKEPGCANPCLNGALLVFGVEGDVPPSRTWSGGGAALVGPSSLTVDTSRDILYVANQGDPTQTTDDSIAIYTKASQANGNLPMTGTLNVTSGSQTVTGNGTIFTQEFAAGDSIGIGTQTYTVSSIASDTSLTLVVPYSDTTASGVPASLLPKTVCSPTLQSGGQFPCNDTKLNNPAGLYLDPDKNHLYVSNTSDSLCTNPDSPCNSILVFHDASNIHNGDALPDLILTSDALNSPRGLALDSGRDILYVANNGGQSVLAFKNVIGLTGTNPPVKVDPDAQISGVTTGINAPVGVAIDSGRDILYVLNQGTAEILVFDKASTQNGNNAPNRTISGSFMKTLSGFYLDPDNNLLYVVDQGANALYVFTDASTAQGEADHRTLTGNNTALNQPAAIFVDTTR